MYGTAADDDRALLASVSKNRGYMAQLCRPGPGRYQVDTGAPLGIYYSDNYYLRVLSERLSIHSVAQGGCGLRGAAGV